MTKSLPAETSYLTRNIKDYLSTEDVVVLSEILIWKLINLAKIIMNRNFPMIFKAKCSTTAMGIMPHKDVDKALELAMGLDIPFWPQLPHVSLYEDMYIQTSENFPGIAIDFEKGRLTFNTARFEEELEDYFTKMEHPETYALTEEYSRVFQTVSFQRPSGL